MAGPTDVPRAGQLLHTGKRCPRSARGFPRETRSVLQRVSGDPVVRLKGDIHKRLQVVEPERGAIALGTRLILERSGGGHCKEQSLLADILSDNRSDASALERHRGSFGRCVSRHDRCRWASGSFTVLRFSSRGRRDWWGYRSDRDYLRRKDC